MNISELGEDIGNIKNAKDEYFKIHWNKRTQEVYLSKSGNGPWYLRKASSKEEAFEIARASVDSIID